MLEVNIRRKREMKFETVGFIGLGLIGGSIAKKLKADHPEIKIIATASRQSTITEAYESSLIDNDTLLDIKDFGNCDLIFLCAPVQKNLEYLSTLKDVIKADCYITDVGSTKTEIHKEVIRLGLEKNFIGGHPMTGSEKTGITNANKYLLENAYYIITPTNCTPEKDIKEFQKLVESFGSISMILDYETHDYATASISHLPHMIAFSLVNLVKKCDDNNETMKSIAAGGFKDITRIASSSPIMWQNICFSNKEQLIKQMNTFVSIMEQLKASIEEENEKDLLEFFQEAKDYRDSISIPSKKIKTSYYEIYLDLVDEAGGIATIATILASKSISIKNIGIINNREFEDGVLRIEFNDNNAKELAIELLKQKNYHIYER